MTDEELAASAKAGDPEALQGLVDRFAPQVYSICRQVLGDHADAEDASQEVFLRLLRELPRYEEGRPLSPWLLKMAANLAMNSRRGRNRRVERELNPKPPESSEGRETEADRISEAIEDLPPRYGLALIYKFREGFTPAQIAELLDISPDSVRVVIFRALAMLREQVTKRREERP
jgi:RNA polymerase sigma-70 factor (ECF subfamily)